jgi:hypothetical protein
MMICEGSGKYMITLTHFNVGEDLLIIITGGDEHIGGISLLENNSFTSISKKNHKDTYVTKMIAPIIYNALHKDVLVVCGIHLDDATKEDIDTVLANTHKCVEEFLKEI